MSAPDDLPWDPSALDPVVVVATMSRLLAEDDQGRAGARPLLTPHGLAHVQGRLRAARARLDGDGGDDPRPRWDPVRQRLWLGAALLREYHRAAPAQAAVLAAFERLGWPTGPVPDPLPPDPADRPADAPRRLRETVKNLNRGLLVGGLQFRADGDRVWCVRGAVDGGD